MQQQHPRWTTLRTLAASGVAAAAAACGGGCLSALFGDALREALLGGLWRNCIAVGNRTDAPVDLWAAVRPTGSGGWVVDGPWELPAGSGLVHIGQQLVWSVSGEVVSMPIEEEEPWPAFIFVRDRQGRGQWLEVTGGIAAELGHPGGDHASRRCRMVAPPGTLPAELGDLVLPVEPSAPAAYTQNELVLGRGPVVMPLEVGSRREGEPGAPDH